MDKNVPINIIFNLLCISMHITPPPQHLLFYIDSVSYIGVAFYFFKKGSGCRKNVVTASGSFSFDWNPTTVFKCLTSPLFLVLVEAQEAQEMVEFSQSFRCWQLYKKAATHSVRVMPKRKWRSFSMGEKEKNLSPATPSAVLKAGPSGRQVPSIKNFEWKQQQPKRRLRGTTSSSSLLRRNKKKKGGANFTAIRVHSELQSDR